MHAGDLRQATNELNLLSRDSYNALVDSLKDKNLTQPGYSFADRQQAIRPAKTLRRYFYFQCESPLVERSVFGIIDNPFQAANDPPIVLAENINSLSNASPFQLFTNVEAYEPTSPYGFCKAIDYYEPTLLFVSDDANIPLVGMPCGPDYDTDNWGISGQSYGLICISALDENNNVWCIRTNEPNAIIGTIVDSDVPAYAASNNQLGEGLIQVQYRNPDAANELVNASGPDGTELQLIVFNASTNVFKVNDLVKCVAVTGVGLVIIDTKSLIYGRAAANIEHFTSGVVNIYTGVPGSEAWDGQTTVFAFNHIDEVIRNEWVFLTSSGNKAVPYYIVSSEYRGKILGKTTEDFDGSPDEAVEVQIYAGDPGSEINIGETVSGFPGKFFGAIPKGSWVICNFVGGDVDEVGAWEIIQTQRGNFFVAQVKPGSADPNTGYCEVDTVFNVELLDGVDAEDDTGISVIATSRLFPVCDNEIVTVEYNGDLFIVTNGELSGGFYAVAQQQTITNNSTGTVAMKPIPNSQVLVSSLKVSTQEGDVEQGRTVTVNRNRGGFYIISKSCS